MLLLMALLCGMMVPPVEAAWDPTHGFPGEGPSQQQEVQAELPDVEMLSMQPAPPPMQIVMCVPMHWGAPHGGFPCDACGTQQPAGHWGLRCRACLQVRVCNATCRRTLMAQLVLCRPSEEHAIDAARPAQQHMFTESDNAAASASSGNGLQAVHAVTAATQLMSLQVDSS